MTVLEKTLRWVVLAGIFALPFIVFIVTTSLFFPYITGKNFAFRLIVEIITGAWLALALVRAEYRPRRSWFLAAFALFVVIVAIADAQGVYPFKSFWSNYERMDGWVTLAHLFAYFVVASSILRTEKLWRWFWLTSVGVSVAVGLWGLLQLFGIYALGEGGASGLSARLDATFGNPIYLAAFMLFNIFISALLIAADGRRPWILPERLLWAGGLGVGLAVMLVESGFHSYVLWLAYVIFLAGFVWLLFRPTVYLLSLTIVLDTLVLFFTGTRGTILGLIGGTILSALIIAFFARDSKRVRQVAIGSVIGIIAIAGGFWLIRDAKWVHSVGFLDRLATISITDNTVKARFMNWGMAWEGVKERPILGWGQENYAIVFDKYYNPRMYAQEQWFDRVHNIVFDWLVAAGFLGLLGYLSLFACAMFCIWRGASFRADAGSDKAAFSVLESSILTGLLAGYFFHNLFVFDNITSYVLFASVLAYIASRDAAARNAAPLISSELPYEALPIIAVLSTILVWGAAWGVNGKALAQNRALLRAISTHQEGISKNIDYFKEAISYGSLGTQEVREQLAQMAFSVASSQQFDQTVKKEILDLTAHEIKLQAESSPLDARAPLFLGTLFDAYGDYTDAIPALTRAHELSLGKQTILFELAQNAQARGDAKGEAKYYKDAFDLAPEFQDARIYYASTVIRAGDDSLGDSLLAPIIKSGAAANSVIAGAYVSRGRYDKIAAIWQAEVATHPQNSQARLTLAASLYAMGRSIEAIAQLEEAGRVIPDMKKEADSLIEQIRNGSRTIKK